MSEEAETRFGVHAAMFWRTRYGFWGRLTSSMTSTLDTVNTNAIHT